MKRICAASGVEFTVTDADQDFYQKMGVPIPTLCPDERQRRRLAWRNERQLYWRTCDGTGKRILSVFSANKPFKAYEPDYWYGDGWDGKAYGREFDFSRPFFEQWYELMLAVPHCALSVVGLQNSAYVNQCGWSKDCYFTFEADHNDTCFHSCHIYNSRHCSECHYTLDCELCYECVDVRNCYDLRYSQNCKNCHESWFLKNCIGCKNCFGCVNLRNKQYYWLNQKCTKEEYQQKLANVDLANWHELQRMGKQFAQFTQKFPHKYIHGTQNEDSTGDYLDNTQRCRQCFDVWNSQDCAYVSEVRNAKNCYDMVVWGGEDGAEFCYECHEVGMGVRDLAFCDQVWVGCSNIWYSKLCVNNSHDLFGCVGMKKAAYCILNKEYTKEEYETLRAKIIEHMKETGEWGEFFPIKYSPFGYNETIANQYFPLTENEVKAKGWQWRAEDPKEYKPATASVPASIDQTDDSICGELLACAQSQKNYRIQKPELDWYRRMGLPLPHFCFERRVAARQALRNPRTLYTRQCEESGVELQTTFAPDRPEKILSEEEYWKVVE